MWDSLENVLANVLLILFPVLFYLVFFREKENLEAKKFAPRFFLILLLALLLTMNFPAVDPAGYIYDLRIIPIIITFVYIGIWPGILMVAIMLFCNFFISDTSMVQTLINYIIASALLSLIRMRYRFYRIQKKIFLICLFILMTLFTREIHFISNELWINAEFALYYTLITLITITAVILLIDILDKQMLIKREVEHIEKINAVSQLAASVAHEVRNPMTTVRGFLQLLLTNQNISEKEVSFLKISLGELDRAQGIITDYLALSKPEVKRDEKLNLSEVLEKSINVITPYAMTNNIEILSTIEKYLHIRSFRVELMQVFINIMKNAIEAMEYGKSLEVSAAKVDDWIEIRIKDQGEGIPPEVLKKLGTPYLSTKKEGTGLGLTVCYEIIKRLQGRIEVKSKVGQGTTFIISLR